MTGGDEGGSREDLGHCLGSIPVRSYSSKPTFVPTLAAWVEVLGGGMGREVRRETEGGGGTEGRGDWRETVKVRCVSPNSFSNSIFLNKKHTLCATGGFAPGAGSQGSCTVTCSSCAARRARPVAQRNRIASYTSSRRRRQVLRVMDVSFPPSLKFVDRATNKPQRSFFFSGLINRHTYT